MNIEVRMVKIKEKVRNLEPCKGSVDSTPGLSFVDELSVDETVPKAELEPAIPSLQNQVRTKRKFKFTQADIRILAAESLQTGSPWR